MTYHSNELEHIVKECTGVHKRPRLHFLTQQQHEALEQHSRDYFTRDILYPEMLRRANISHTAWDTHPNSYVKKRIQGYLRKYKTQIIKDWFIIDKLNNNELIGGELKDSPALCVSDWKNMTQDEKAPYYSC